MINEAQKASFFEEAFFHSEKTYIHPTAIVGQHVKLGNNVKVGPFCVITGNVTIESGTRIFAHVTIGFPAEVRGIKQSLGSLHIKKNCEIREFASIHASKYEHGATIIGNNCYIMNYAHISHDSVLGDNVTLINCVNLGGHTRIDDNVMMMANSASHQFCHVGEYSALGPYSGIRQDLPPYSLFNGLPGAFAGLNLVALKRAGFSRESINAIKTVTRLFYQEKKLLNDIKTQAAHEAWGSDEHVQKFLTFITNSNRGVSRLTIAQQNAERNHTS